MFALGVAAGREVARLLAEDPDGESVVVVGLSADGKTSIHQHPCTSEVAELLSAEYAAGRKAITIERSHGEIHLMTGDPGAAVSASTILCLFHRSSAERIETSVLVDQYPTFDFAQLIDGFASAIQVTDIAYGVLDAPEVQLIQSTKPLRLFDSIRKVARSEMRRTVRDLLDEGGVFVTVPFDAPGLVVPPEARPNDGELDVPIDEIVTFGDKSIAAMCRVDDGPPFLCVIPWAAIRGAWRAVLPPDLPDYVAFVDPSQLTD